MSRIGAIVRKLYADELKSTPGKAVAAEGKGEGFIRRRLGKLTKALSNRRTLVWFIRIFTILVVLVVIAEAVYQYNLLTSWYTVTSARRADVDFKLKRRQNLIPNLVYAVSKYAAYEESVFRYVSDAREALKTIGSPEAAKAGAGGELQKTLSSLIALAERYPDLKATQPIQDLIKEVVSTENIIAEAKEKYNRACETYNQYRSVFPGNVFAFIYRFEPLPFIGMEEKFTFPAIDLKMTLGTGGIEDGVKVSAKGLNNTEGVEE